MAKVNLRRTFILVAIWNSNKIEQLKIKWRTSHGCSWGFFECKCFYLLWSLYKAVLQVLQRFNANNAAFEQKAMTFDMQKKASADTTAQWEWIVSAPNFENGRRARTVWWGNRSWGGSWRQWECGPQSLETKGPCGTTSWMEGSTKSEEETWRSST